MRMKRAVVVWLLLSMLGLGGVALLLSLTWIASDWQWSNNNPPFYFHLGPGDLAPDFTLRDLDGKSFHLAEEAAKSPIVLEIGSFT